MTPESGKPYTRTFTATTTATTFYPPPDCPETKFVQIKNDGAVVVNLFWDSNDSADSTRAIPLQASGTTGDYFEGPANLFAAGDPHRDGRGGITLTAASSTASVRVVFYSESV